MTGSLSQSEGLAFLLLELSRLGFPVQSPASPIIYRCSGTTPYPHISRNPDIITVTTRDRVAVEIDHPSSVGRKMQPVAFILGKLGVRG